ncbi:MAG: HpcH/HpaI aldolase/citrate lyase family protein [Rhodocyclaceae bacterium]|nr:HpcH/HpaI aldolase/citrate lyase family protein [Rhodocyclaceae bacterium]
MHDTPQLGASLYVPTTHCDLVAIAAAKKLADLRSVIFCTEDAVSDADLPAALANLGEALRHCQPRPGYHRFIRARNPAVLETLLDMPGITRIDGFVLPKITALTLDAYVRPLVERGDAPVWIMPTLETREVFRDADMQQLARQLDAAAWRERILCMRIGGNDLLSLLKMRRPRGRTIYETPIGQVIARLATTFIPYGFALSAPVFEHFGDVETLQREIQADLNHGLTGKTAIHPRQVALIEKHYRVDPQDLDAAERILRQDAPGVFELHESMCEPATHRPWARLVVEAARRYGKLTPA